MKIAILIPMFLPKHCGGVEVATYDIAARLAARGHELHVITLWDRGLSKESTEQGFLVRRVKMPRIKLFGVIIFWLKIFFLLKKICPDMVHVQSITISMPAYLAWKFLRKPYLVCGHGFDVYSRWRLKNFISKLALKNARCVVALTESMKTSMQRIWNRKISVIPNGIDLELFSVSVGKEAVRKELGLALNDKVIIFAGFLRPVKGVEILLEAMNIIAEKDSGIKLIIVGGGRVDYFKRKAKSLNLENQVIFTGELSRKRVFSYLSASDLFVLPSFSEGFSIVSLEAMAAGLPVIATKVGVLPELIEEGVNGFLVATNNPVEIANKALKLLTDEGSMSEISENNRTKAKNYNWSGIIKKLEEAYQSCL